MPRFGLVPHLPGHVRVGHDDVLGRGLGREGSSVPVRLSEGRDALVCKGVASMVDRDDNDVVDDEVLGVAVVGGDGEGERGVEAVGGGEVEASDGGRGDVEGGGFAAVGEPGDEHG